MIIAVLPGLGFKHLIENCKYSASDAVGRAIITQSTLGKSTPSVKRFTLTRILISCSRNFRTARSRFSFEVVPSTSTAEIPSELNSVAILIAESIE